MDGCLLALALWMFLGVVSMLAFESCVSMWAGSGESEEKLAVACF